jgi:hypothetical protein
MDARNLSTHVAVLLDRAGFEIFFTEDELTAAGMAWVFSLQD